MSYTVVVANNSSKNLVFLACIGCLRLNSSSADVLEKCTNEFSVEDGNGVTAMSDLPLRNVPHSCSRMKNNKLSDHCIIAANTIRYCK